MKITHKNKAIKASVTGKIPYDLVSMCVVLRDWIDIADDNYINSEHKALVDMADAFYNLPLSIVSMDRLVSQMEPDKQDIYNAYGKQYFDMVLKDAGAIDSQITRSNVNDLVAEYNDKATAIENGIKASTKPRRKAVKSSMSHKRRYIKSDIDIWDDLGFSDFDDIDWAELFGLETEEVFYDSVRQYLGMNPDDDVEFVDIVEYVNNHPKYYNMLKEAYYNGFDDIGASARRRSVKASNNIQSQFDVRTQFQTFLSKVDREVSNSLYGYDDARWDVKGTMSVDSEGYWFELNLWCDNKEAGTVNISVDTNSNYRTATAAYVVTVPETDEVQAEGKSFDDVYETCVGELIRLAEDYVNFVRDDWY